VALAAVAYGVTHIPPFPSLDFFATGRAHLDPIPIDRTRACSHVEAIHLELNRFQDAYFATAFFGLDQQQYEGLAAANQVSGSSTTTPRPFDVARWPLVKAELDGDAQQLDGAIASGTAAFPPRIQRELGAVRDALARGRVELVGTTDPTKLLRRTNGLFERGQKHVGWASDLVGRQCAVPLGATGSRILAQPD
jgi:hypothetical protein